MGLIVTVAAALFVTLKDQVSDVAVAAILVVMVCTILTVVLRVTRLVGKR